MKTHLHDEGPVGRVLPPRTLILRVDCGTAKDPETGESVYEMTSSVDGTPIIRHVPTGKWWTCSWRRLIALAEAEGLSDEHETPVVSTGDDS